MSLNFEEIDYQNTELGELVLRRRRMQQFGDLDIFEVKLGDEFLMTSLFHEAEDQLAHMGLAGLKKDKLDVAIGGLGLGHTAVAALENPQLSSLTVIEYLEPVIGWHKSRLVPAASTLMEDQRCLLKHADFFDLKGSLDKHDAILLDIDHRPDFVLNASNKGLYTEKGLTELAGHLNVGGVFAMWADGKPQESFTELLSQAFSSAQAHTVEFDNPVTGGSSFGTVYVANLRD